MTNANFSWSTSPPLFPQLQVGEIKMMLIVDGDDELPMMMIMMVMIIIMTTLTTPSSTAPSRELPFPLA